MLAASAAWGGAQLTAEPASFDLGRQAMNAGRYAFSFRLRNTGDRMLQIAEVRPGCHCVTAELADNLIPPGGEVELKGEFNGAGYEGHVEESVLVATNDGEEPLRVLKFRIFLPYSQTGVRLLPKGGAAAVRVAGEKRTAAGEVENCNPAGTVTVTGVRLPDGWRCASKLPLAVKPESRERLEFARDAGGPAEFRGLPFAVLTDAKGQAELGGTLSSAEKQKKAPDAGGAGTAPGKPAAKEKAG